MRFTFASATITDESRLTLDRVAAAIKACPSTRLRIEGHTDADGDETRNLNLSERRAASVVEYLTKTGGVDAARITAVGFGQTKPIAPNDSAENKGKNRRIDFVVD